MPERLPGEEKQHGGDHQPCGKHGVHDNAVWGIHAAQNARQTVYIAKDGDADDVAPYADDEPPCLVGVVAVRLACIVRFPNAGLSPGVCEHGCVCGKQSNDDDAVKGERAAEGHRKIGGPSRHRGDGDFSAGIVECERCKQPLPNYKGEGMARAQAK